MERKNDTFSYGFSIYHNQGDNLDKAKELKNAIETEITEKFLMFLEHNDEYQKTILQLKDYEEHLYSVETDNSFFEDFSVYEDDPIDYRYSDDKYKRYLRAYENYEETSKQHNTKIEELKVELAELEKTIPNRRFLTLSQRKAKAKMEELKSEYYRENNALKNEKYYYDKISESKKKQAISDKYMAQHKELADKLYAKAAKIEDDYLQKFAKEAIKNHPFMLYIDYSKNDSFNGLLGLKPTLCYSNSPVRHIRDLKLTKVLDEQVKIIENEMVNEDVKGLQ